MSLLMPNAMVPERQEQVVRCLAELRQQSAEQMATLAREPPLSATFMLTGSPRRGFKPSNDMCSDACGAAGVNQNSRGPGVPVERNARACLCRQ